MRKFSAVLLCATALTFPAAAADLGITATIPMAPTPYSSGDSEYTRNWALAAVKAGDANAAGWTGKGQTVAVFDTGINFLNSELGGKLVTGYDAVLGRIDAKPTDVQGHGSFVGGIIAAPRNGVGMEGVAYDAKLMSIRIANSNGSITLSDKSLAAGITYATINKAGVFNNSWNSSASIQDYQAYYGKNTAAAITASLGQSIAAWQTAVNAGTIVTWAAGNDGKAQPGFYAGLPELYASLQKGWVVAVATDQTGKIASYSNRCGLTAAWCMAAPGSNLTSVYYAGGLATGSGTSFAAPVLSGAAAVLKQRWATLTNSQILSIMFSTANKSGIYADKATYGQGMLDMAAAVKPIGTITIPGVTTSAAAAASVAVTSGAFGGALVKSSGSLIVLDAYSRDYAAPVSAFVATQAKPYDMDIGMAGLGQRLTQVANSGGLTFAMVGSSENPAFDSTSTMPKFVMSLSQGPMTTTAAHGLGSAHLFGGIAAEIDGAGTLAQGSAINSAYLGMAGRDSWGSSWSAPFVGDTRLTIAGIYGTIADKPTEWNQLATNPMAKASEAAVTGAALRISKLVGTAKLSAESGMVHESNSVLGSVSEGMMSLGSSADTQYVGFHAEAPLVGTWTAFAGYEAGRTNVQGSADSLVTGMKNLTSDAWSIGVTGTNTLANNDRVTFVVSQPMRVNGGTANLNLPTSQDENGIVSYTGYSQNMTADGRETDLQAGYSLGLSDGEQFTATAMYRVQPDNIKNADNEAVAMGRYQLKF
ncbi:putative Subtilisin [Candidatus Terasakiella magnetica]|nr:putative Subtilisin [Candidatus Terasakiella magnetica]